MNRFTPLENSASSDSKHLTGFTLIEILVAAFIFSIVITAASGIFVSALKSQTRVLSTQLALDNTSYTLEYMARALRMAKKDENGNCIPSKWNYKVRAGGQEIEFLNHNGQCQKFFLQGDTLKQTKAGSTFSLTPNEIEVISLNFSVEGQTQTDNLQPIVTIYLTVKGKVTGEETPPEIKAQTTVTQRNLDQMK